MTTVAQFLKCLSDSELLAPVDLESARSGPLAADSAADAEPLARDLVRQKVLTPFQATVLYRGRSTGLVYGPYVVLDKLGQGGMGMVLKARHRRLNRLVALKVLPLATIRSTRDALKRFDREVKAAARLSHPNIVRAYDAAAAGGVHYLAMEYVAGLDLQECVRRFGPMSAAKAVQCILQAAQGLEHAHQNGIIHRDIKPSNLLLDDQGVVKVLDLGLARIEGALASGEALSEEDLTRTGAVMGTLDYMSPEQALDTKHADHRTDIYSLGCTLYFLLTARTMYAGDTMMKKLLAHREQPVPSLAASAPNVPDSLEAIFQRLVAKRLEARYQSMSDVVAALSDWMAHSGDTSVISSPATKASFSLSGIESDDADFSLRDDMRRDLQSTRAATLDAPALRPKGLSQEDRRRRLLTLGVTGLAILLIASIGVWWSWPNPVPQRRPTPNVVPQPAAIPQWIPLFNGRDLTGWDAEAPGAAGHWKVTDGILQGSGPNSYLFHDQQDFGNFEIRAEVRISSNGNGGLFFRAQPAESLPVGVEVQIGPYDFGDLHLLDPKGGANVAASNRPALTLGPWIELGAIAIDRRIEVTLNGVRVIEHRDDRPHAPFSGRFALQAYDPDTFLEVRKLEVRRIARDGRTIVPDASAAIPVSGLRRAVATFTAETARSIQESWAKHLGRTVSVQNSVGMKFVLIPPGEFRMGSPPDEPARSIVEGPQRAVTLSRPCYFGVHEVTQEQFRKLMSENPSTFQIPDDDVSPRRPVERVTWTEAVRFCEMLTSLDAEKQAGRRYRLPREAEWEYACRAGTATPFATGTALTAGQAAIDQPRSTGRTAAVGTFAPNAFGLFDMHGNVWEWCSDWYDPLYYRTAPAVDPSGPAVSPEGMRAIRGGGLFYSASEARSAFRNQASPEARASDVGFRVVFDIPAEP